MVSPLCALFYGIPRLYEKIIFCQNWCILSSFFADEIVEKILPIAMEYQTTDLMQQCEAFLLQKYFTAQYPFLTTPHIDMVVECLDKAVRYGLKELQKHAEGLLARCLLDTYESLEKYTQLPERIQSSILRKRVKQFEMRYREDSGTHPSSKCMINIKKGHIGAVYQILKFGKCFVSSFISSILPCSYPINVCVTVTVHHSLCILHICHNCIKM